MGIRLNAFHQLTIPHKNFIIIIVTKKIQLLSLCIDNAIDPLFHDFYENLLCNDETDDYDDIDMIETAMKMMMMMLRIIIKTNLIVP